MKSSSSVEQPSLSVLIKLGSIAVHVDEMLSPMGHTFDRMALQQLLKDEEVRTWIAAAGKNGWLPEKRDTQRVKI